MKRVNRIWEHPLYREAYVRIRELEQDREFCGHSAEHFLAVARLMRIYDLQEDTGLSKESIYAARAASRYRAASPVSGGNAPSGGQRRPGGRDSAGLRLSRTL